MSAYSFDSDGGYSSKLTGGSMTPTMASGAASGKLLLLQTGVNSITLGQPSISGWTQLTGNATTKCTALYAKIAAGGDTSPTFQWDGTHQAFSRILCFTGDVYTDLATIVDTSNEHSTNQLGTIAVGATSAPTQANCLALRFGHCVKSATNNGSAFKDWRFDSGIYTKAGSTQLVQNGSALAAGFWYWQQGVATATSADDADLTNTDSSANSQGITLFLKSTQGMPIGMQSL